MQQHIVLVGLSGSGKTTVAPLIAQSLGRRCVDTDTDIVVKAQRPIADIFAREGEAAFRALETQALAAALEQQSLVIATGGGIVESSANRELLRANAFVVWLHARTPSLVERLQAMTDRPLLGDNPEDALQKMAARRTPLYADLADLIITTDDQSPQQIADEVVRTYSMRQQRSASAGVQVSMPGGSYAVLAGPGLLDSLPQHLHQLGLRGRAWLISDTTVMALHGDRVQQLLRDHGHTVEAYSIPTGEQYKTLDTVRGAYDWLLRAGVERGDVVLALGGGVVGDLAGFVAATVLRGIAVIQLPTTVLATVDSALGGKTGVDHAVGKNLIGAFHQPRLVLADTNLLATLPSPERAAGWAEAIKHGVIGDAALFADLRQSAADVLALEEPITGELLQRAAAYKARVVSGDEREQGTRILLNYGHTIGHAVETESAYTLRHGECVAIGMMAAGGIAQRLGLFSSAALAEQQAVLELFGLPTRLSESIDIEQVMTRIGSDKKVRAKRVRWVLPTEIGAATIRDDVPLDLVMDVLSDLR
ncbi:MAG: 3-dehydroquinate synthase [Chloroflexota bacterium]|nr:3-dehydroquinate synthase [Chloroflexota bacterium]